MIIEPAMADYLLDRPRQLRLAQEGQTRSQRWQNRPDVAAFQTLMRGYVQAPPENVAHFAGQLRPFVSDLAWLKSFVADGLAAIAEDPFAVLPWRMQSGAVSNGLALLEDERANAMLCVVDHLVIAGPPDPCLIFDGGYCAIVILDGLDLVVERFSLEPDGERLAPPELLVLGDGDHLIIDASREAIRLRSASRDVVLLRIAVAGAGENALVREFDVRNGVCTRSGTATTAASRILTLLDLVRGNAGADLPAMFARLTQSEDRMVRWQAMRDLLAVDLQAARPILQLMAQSDPDNLVRTAAQAAQGIVAQSDVNDFGNPHGI